MVSGAQTRKACSCEMWTRLRHARSRLLNIERPEAGWLCRDPPAHLYNAALQIQGKTPVGHLLVHFVQAAPAMDERNVRISQIWLPVDSKSTHPMFEPLQVQDRLISILVTKSV